MTTLRATLTADLLLLRGVNRRALGLVDEALRAGGDPSQRVIAEEQGHDPSVGPRSKQRPGTPPPTQVEDLPLLSWAIRKATPGIVQRLIDGGADVHAVDTVRGRTPLLEAALSGKTSAVRALLAAGALLHAQDRQGATAFSWHHPKVRTVLMDAGFDLNTRGTDGWCPLHQAAQQGDPKRVAWCFQHGASVHAVTQQGSTALHLAALRSDPATLRLLLAQGADPMARDLLNRRPYDMAWSAGALRAQAFDEVMAQHEAALFRQMLGPKSVRSERRGTRL